MHTLRVFTMRLFAGVIAAIVLASPGWAGIIVQAVPFSFATPQSNPNFKHFSPSLGTLDSVDVWISGMLSFEVLLGPGETVAPFISFDVMGTIGGGYEFSGPAYFTLPSQTNPNADCGPARCPDVIAPFAVPFSFSFTVNALSDLTGVAFPTDISGIIPPAVEARRADFIGDGQLDIYELQAVVPLNFAPMNGLHDGGTILVTYNYTPIPTAPPTISDPEPATAALFALAPALLLFRRRGAGRRTRRKTG
jgi:hypothetical protein